jgi:type IV pilus assembly protein PilB
MDSEWHMFKIWIMYLLNNDDHLEHTTDSIINDAIQQAASDIHIEAQEHHYRIRYRKNGQLYETTSITKKLAEQLIARLKVLAKLDTAERRLPQDGRFQQRLTDIRINTCPTLFGEKIVLRLLTQPNSTLDLHSLGLTAIQKNLLLEKLTQPQGMILVTGPTGSGKTVTLYSALSILNTPDKNILTVEDPIEIRLLGTNQVNIHSKIGLNYATTLKAFLRQDPDILMVGEIRDKETAEIAIQAAQTGHLVLSTLHTTNSIEALTRIHAMGIPSHHSAQAISLIIAQRLLRVLCSYCKEPDTINHFRAVGCPQCLQGYSGRIGCYELLPISPKLSQAILTHANSEEILIIAKQEGFLSLYEDGMNKVTLGITSLAELNRVLKK